MSDITKIIGVTMLKAIGYLRVSTQGQVDDGISLDAQRAKIQAWCEVNDYELTDIFMDEGVSGKSTTHREGVRSALDALVVYSMSRLTRSTKDMLIMAEGLEKRGVDLVSICEKIDTTSASGRMIFRILAVLGEFERDLVSERTRSALQYKKAQGERVGNIAYGYQLEADGKTLVENTDEQRALTLIGQLRETGYSLRAIATRLNQDGMTTRKGTVWKHQYVSSLLKAIG